MTRMYNTKNWFYSD